MMSYDDYCRKQDREDAAQALCVRATDSKPEDDNLFYADRVVGYVITLLAGIGIGATVTAICVWVAVKGGGV